MNFLDLTNTETYDFKLTVRVSKLQDSIGFIISHIYSYIVATQKNVNL